MQLSKNLSLREAAKSMTAKRLGIDNSPADFDITNLKAIAEKIFQPVRDHFGVPIAVSSGFRSKALNKAIGGAKFSQHMVGEALDLDADVYGKVTNKEIFDYIKENLEFDQIIWEFGDDENPNWVHVSYKRDHTNKDLTAKSARNRNRALKAVRGLKGVHYEVIT